MAGSAPNSEAPTEPMLEEPPALEQGVASFSQHQILAALKEVATQLRELPQNMASKLPAALRAHDDAEKQRAEESSELTELQKRVELAGSCVEIGRLPGVGEIMHCALQVKVRALAA